MSENLGNFLVDLACKPDLMARFLGDPAGVLAQSPLSEDERTIVMTRDSRLIADALGTTGYALGLGIDGGKPAKKAPARKAPGKKKAPKRVPPKKKAPARKSPRKGR